MISMRGTASPSRMLVLKDGVPLNTTFSGKVNLWGTLSVEDIEKIKIVRGASSALYGSSAMGGVINIITCPTRKKAAESVSFEAGDSLQVKGWQGDLCTGGRGEITGEYYDIK